MDHRTRLERRSDLIRYVEWLTHSQRLRQAISDPELRFQIALDMTLAIDDWAAINNEEFKAEPF